MENKPVIKLLSIAGHEPQVFSQVWLAAKSRESIENALMPVDELNRAMSADIPPQEFITTIWLIEGMPRSFWDQFDRTRHAAFWEQSMRLVNLSSFWYDKEFWVPESIKNNPVALNEYIMAMKNCQEAYVALLNAGVPQDDARGVIPLHILTRGTCAINLRALKGLIQNRLCFVAQGEYWRPVVSGILEELKKYLTPEVIKSLVTLPCAGKKECPIGEVVSKRLTDEDPFPVCPLYLEHFAKDKKAATEYTFKKHPSYLKIKDAYFASLKSLKMFEGR